MYEGEVKNNKPNGRGRMVLADNTELFGNFENGKMNGFGIAENKGFIKEIGFFKNNRLIGETLKIYMNKKNKIGFVMIRATPIMEIMTGIMIAGFIYYTGLMVSSGEIDTIPAEALLYDDASKLAYKTGEDVPFSGKVVWYFSEGKLQQETEYKNGRENGSTIWWHEDGTRAGQTFHHAGVLDGPLVQWYPGGEAKELQGMYNSGRRDGQYVKWHKNGGKRSVTNYEKGKREGRAAQQHQANLVEGFRAPP